MQPFLLPECSITKPNLNYCILRNDTCCEHAFLEARFDVCEKQTTLFQEFSFFFFRLSEFFFHPLLGRARFRGTC